MLPEFDGVHDVPTAQAAFRAWMFDRALPFWASAGSDAPGLGAREQLKLDGSFAEVGYKRMRVQARQIYAFSHAALLGWREGAAVAESGYRFITATGERGEGGWVRRLSPDGTRVLDPAVDLYDQAFVLFALAWYARLTGEREPLDRARRTVEWITAHMRQGAEGFYNVLPEEPGPRQQNPHMHLLEAALALYETSQDGLYLELADELAALFRQRFYDPETGALGEFFETDWRVAPGAAGDHVEPGHQFEWAWLLDQYARLSGVSMAAEVEGLYRGACEHGVDRGSWMVFDRVGRDGRIQSRATRLWPQTESLKAHAVMSRQAERGEAIAAVVKTLGTRFFAPAPDGAWVDQLDADGRPLGDKIPTSSFYHVFMAFAELERLGSAPAA